MDKRAGQLLVVATVLALTACKPAPAPPAPTDTVSTPTKIAQAYTVVKIGQAAPLSGPLSHLGRDSIDGALLAIAELNAHPMLLHGKPLRFELVAQDDQADPQKAVEVARKLVASGVIAVIGHLNSGTSIAASSVYFQAGIPQLSPSATNPAYTQQGFNTTFRLVANDVQQGQALADYATQRLHARKLVVIDDQSSYGHGLAIQFISSARSQGATVLQRQQLNASATDFNAILRQIKRKKPELIFYGGVDAQAAALITQMRRQGIKTPMMAGDGVATPEFIKMAGSAAEGQYAALASLPFEQMPGLPAFRQKFKTAFNLEVQLYAPYAYDAVNVLVNAIQRSQSLNSKTLIKQLAQTRYPGLTGSIAFDQHGDIQRGAISLYQVQHGQWRPVGLVQH